MWWTRCFLFLASLLVSAVFYHLVPESYRSSTSSDYLPQIQNIQLGHGFIEPETGRLMDRYPPLYPLFHVFVNELGSRLRFSRQTAVSGSAAFIIAFISVLVLELAILIMPRRAALLPAILFSVHPFILYGLLVPLSTTFFLPFFLSSLLLFLKGCRHLEDPYLYFAGCGLLLGLALLVRPTPVFYAPVLGVVILATLTGVPVKRRIACASIVFAAALLTILPWEYSVYRRNGTVVLLSSGGANSVRDGLSFNQKAFRKKINLPADVSRLSDKVWDNYDRLSSLGTISHFMWDRFKEKPSAVLRLYWLKAMRSWYGTDSQESALETATLIVTIFTVLPACLGLFRYMRSGKWDRPFVFLMLSTVAYFWLMTIAVLSIVRYMVPAIVLLLVFVPFVPVRRRGWPSLSLT
jgi:4-amino-4-deoxy-L-arabinose transferase-like glycosyltransferase